ncbi:hypothetical protein PF005_g29799 [Phytophthora fragariae]|uniref:Secreted protein n=2 Tax=Phytophthora TaxID=4783 RepID=A0A6A4BCN8_9STRA|nr:hypothetical protein PF003_g15985 [Phytophthora fragariae]KAE9271830.1 hypothetical protein PR003_g30392 [Phytophthora rubi]KAE8900118.1 hypothetical protein PF003_g15994 [Phytophthora fragariae]KAE8919550.1 hypothetical protein PF009_g30144 [Phytophthora fragariae]KAE8963833.1 hypothetical protein PF011_g28890 [Phytophthora fragariae]
MLLCYCTDTVHFYHAALLVALLVHRYRPCLSCCSARGSCNIPNVVRMLTQVTLTQCMYRGINPLRAVHPSFFGIPMYNVFF